MYLSARVSGTQSVDFSYLGTIRVPNFHGHYLDSSACRWCPYADKDGQPILALLLALARDPLLRTSAPPVLRMRPGEELARQQMIEGESGEETTTSFCLD
jgi:hypothetical protein